MRSIRICSSAPCSLILLIAKPTWMSTQSPGPGMSSWSRPRSTRRRTPVTSTMAWLGRSAISSTTLPGMARHMGYHPALRAAVSPGDDVERALELVFHSQHTPAYCDRPDVVVRLLQRELPECAEHRSHERDSRGDQLAQGDAMEAQRAGQGDLELPLTDLPHRRLRARVDDLGVLGGLEHLVLRHLLDLAPISVAHLTLDGKRVRGHSKREGPRRLLRIETDVSLETADRKGGIVAHGREHSPGERPEGKATRSRINHEGAGAVRAWRATCVG